MTSHENGPEDLLRDAFRDRVDNTDFAATPMSDVVSTARVIRQRRRNTTLLATAAAVVIVTVPTAVVLNVNDPKGAPPSGPSSRTPSPPVTPDVTLESLPMGPPPEIGYVDAGTYIAPDGTRTPVPVEHGISGIAPFDGGFLIADTVTSRGPAVSRSLTGTPGRNSVPARAVPARSAGTGWWPRGRRSDAPRAASLHRQSSTAGGLTAPTTRSSPRH